MSQTVKTIFYKTLSENLIGFAIKVSKTFRKNVCLLISGRFKAVCKMLINIMINHLRSFVLAVP